MPNISPNVLEEAREAVKAINLKDLHIIKSFVHPPAIVGTIAKCLLLLLSWPFSKKDGDSWKVFLSNLKNPKDLLDKLTTLEVG